MSLIVMIVIGYLVITSVTYLVLENSNNQEYEFTEDQRAINVMWATFWFVLILAMFVLIVIRVPKNLMTYLDLLRRGIPLAINAMTSMFVWEKLNPLKSRRPYDL
jgi:heme/copper-type cytochrome/quinol oxidase subunit 2